MAKATEKTKEIVQRSQAQIEELRGPRARLKDQVDVSIPIIAIKVFCNVYSTGPRGSLIAMPLHEIPLARRKIEVLHQELHVDPSYPEGAPRERNMTAADLQNEYERLRQSYVFADGDAETSKYDLLTDMYGRPHEGRLVAVIRRQHAAWKKMVAKKGPERPSSDEKKPGSFYTKEDWEAIIALALPEQDFIESSPLEQ